VASLGGDPVTDTVLPPPPAPARAATAYVFTNDNQGAARLALTLLREGFHLAVATQPLRADGRSWPRGTFIARLQRNPATLADRRGEPADPTEEWQRRVASMNDGLHWTESILDRASSHFQQPASRVERMLDCLEIQIPLG